MEAQLAADHQRASEALSEASAKAVEEHEALQKELQESQEARADLEAKVARVAGSLKAADELKEARLAIKMHQNTSGLFMLPC